MGKALGVGNTVRNRLGGWRAPSMKRRIYKAESLFCSRVFILIKVMLKRKRLVRKNLESLFIYFWAWNRLQTELMAWHHKWNNFVYTSELCMRFDFYYYTACEISWILCVILRLTFHILKLFKPLIFYWNSYSIYISITPDTIHDV